MASPKKTTPELTPDQLRVVREYAFLIDDDTWKQRLSRAWLQGECNANGLTHVFYAQQPALQSLASSHGESWLAIFKLPEVD